VNEGVYIEDKVCFSEAGKPYKEMEVGLSPEQEVLARKHEASAIADKSVFSNVFIHFADAIVSTLQAGEYQVADAVTFEEGVRIQELMDSHKNKV
jgi:hypothetical protein